RMCAWPRAARRGMQAPGSRRPHGAAQLGADRRQECSRLCCHRSARVSRAAFAPVIRGRSLAATTRRGTRVSRQWTALGTPPIGLWYAKSSKRNSGNGHVRKLLQQLGYSVQRPTTRLVQADVKQHRKWVRYTYPNLKKTPKAKVR